MFARRSMFTRQFLWGGLAFATGMLPATAPAGEIANYSPVTEQRLTNPEPGNWMLYRRTYDGHGYSLVRPLVRLALTLADSRPH